jgi:hypothetical protein
MCERIHIPPVEAEAKFGRVLAWKRCCAAMFDQLSLVNSSAADYFGCSSKTVIESEIFLNVLSPSC